MITAHRTQIYLDDFRYNELKERARKEGKSSAQVVREAIDAQLKKKQKVDKKEKEKVWREFFKLAGAFNSGLSDVSRNHDRYLAEDEIKSWNRNRK